LKLLPWNEKNMKRDFKGLQTYTPSFHGKE